MMNPASLRNAEAALDALARGHAVRLRDVDQECLFQPAEAPVSPGLGRRVVLSSQRARFLGLQAAGNPVTIDVTEPVMVKALLAARTLPQELPYRPANALEALALALVRRVGLLPAALIMENAGDALRLSVQEAGAYLALPPELTLDTQISLPIAACENTQACLFTERGGNAHLALLMGDVSGQAVPLVRLHSSCLTGDLLGSLRCDCGSQLQEGLRAIAASGGGVMLYLNQEGRGIGLVNKLRAYRLQEEGLDTVDANLALGFAEDARDFSIAARMLQALGITRIRLLTNNPAKVEALQAAGVEVVERIAHVIPAGEHNRNYLAAKAARLRHQF